MSSHPIAVAVPRPLCWAVCARVAGQVDLQVTRTQRPLLEVDRLVLVYSSMGDGSPEWHRGLAAACRAAEVEAPDQRFITKGVWRGIAQIRTIHQTDPHDPGRVRVGLQGLHLFRFPSRWGAPSALEEQRLWLPSDELVEALVTKWQRDEGAPLLRRAS